MSELRASLTEFIPQLRDLSSVGERLSMEENVRLGQLKQQLGDIAKENVREEMRASGLNLSNRKGGLLDSVSYEWEYEDWGEVAVGTDYATTLEYGADMRDYMLGKVVPIKTPEGTIFRTVSRTPNNLRNWVIRSYGYFEGAQHRTASSGKAVSIVESIKELGLKKVLEEESVGAENLPWTKDLESLLDMIKGAETKETKENNEIESLLDLLGANESKSEFDKNVDSLLELLDLGKDSEIEEFSSLLHMVQSAQESQIMSFTAMLDISEIVQETV